MDAGQHAELRHLSLSLSIYIYIYYIHTYIASYLCLSLSLSVYIYIYIHIRIIMCVCVYIYIYIYVHIWMQDNTPNCGICGTRLGKRHLAPRHHCRLSIILHAASVSVRGFDGCAFSLFHIVTYLSYLLTV